MKGSTKINTYIYHEINTGPVGTSVGVLLAAVKTTVILCLKQYSFGFCESSAYVGFLLFFFTVVSKQVGMEVKYFYLGHELRLTSSG